ncbi:I78 family peptidase inhibitor [Paracoccus pacificus]|uniref:I78 family peptidase inhibitor n=2 Tax=Paracoccus pacificus TaxID=1463598 RepID=A0ABW4RB08_9RHOB
MKLAIPAALGAVTLLTACQPADTTTVVVTPPADCNAAAYQQYVGQKSPAISLPAGTEFRHYRTGDPVTMDLNPARVNFEYDRTGKLVKVTCG